MPLNRTEKFIFGLPVLIGAAWFVWNRWPRSERVMVTYELGWQITAVRFSPDGSQLAVATNRVTSGGAGAIRQQYHLEVWRLGAAQAAMHSDDTRTPSGWMLAPQWTSNGHRLVGAFVDEASPTSTPGAYKTNFATWDCDAALAHEETPFPQRAASDPPTSLGTLPDGRYFAGGQSLAVLDERSLQLQKRLLLNSPSEAVTGVSFDSHQHLLATVPDVTPNSAPQTNARVRLWDFKTLRPLRALPLNAVRGASWSPVSGELAVWQGSSGGWPADRSGALSIWNTDGTRRLWQAPFANARLFSWSPNKAAFAVHRTSFALEDGELQAAPDALANFSYSSSIEWWDSARHKMLWSQPLAGWMEEMQISPDGHALYGFEDHIPRSDNNTDNEVRGRALWVWDTSNGTVLWHRSLNNLSAQQTVTAQWAPRGAKLALGAGNKLEVVDLNPK